MMGRASRWLRVLFGGRKSQNPKDPKGKNDKGWGIFVKSFREKDRRRPPTVGEDGDYDLCVDPNEEQQIKRAIAVAAGTAAVAEAAVAAAQAAAAAVVGLAGRRARRAEDLAAVKIQAAFRAYLARRALRALKGLVKLQALVRGNIVRKQAAETLRCMQALVRVQARARACRALRSEITQRNRVSRMHPGPSMPEKRANANKHERSSTFKRNSSEQTSTDIDGFDQQHSQPSELRWLDQWMEERYWDTAMFGAMAECAPVDDEKNAKILEIDTEKPHNYSAKQNAKNNYRHLSYSDLHSHSFTTAPDSPSKDSTIAHSPSSFGIPMCYEHGESPQFLSASSSRPAGLRAGPFTTSKSECSRSLFSGYSDFPNYMSHTESSRAKVRSQSVPKQRPEFEKSGSIRRGFGHGLGQQWSLGQGSLLHPFASKGYRGSGRLDRLVMPIKI